MSGQIVCGCLPGTTVPNAVFYGSLAISRTWIQSSPAINRHARWRWFPTPEGLYFSSDTPLESNHVYRLDRGGMVAKVAALSSSSIYGCRAGGGIFFSTMVEPSQTNLDPNVQLYGSRDGLDWRSLMQWRKDFWPMSLFQYGNAILPDGRNKTEFLALTTVAVKRDDLTTSIWRVRPRGVL